MPIIISCRLIFGAKMRSHVTNMFKFSTLFLPLAFISNESHHFENPVHLKWHYRSYNNLLSVSNFFILINISELFTVLKVDT